MHLYENFDGVVRELELERSRFKSLLAMKLIYDYSLDFYTDYRLLQFRSQAYFMTTDSTGLGASHTHSA